MKIILKLLCLILTIYAVYFPISYFGKNSDKMEVRVSHILVDSEEQSKIIRQNILDGKKFEDMAKEYSLDSKATNGDIGYTQRGRLENNINDAVFTLNKNEISEPIQTRYGWHIVKVTEIKYYSDENNLKYNPYKYLDLQQI